MINVLTEMPKDVITFRVACCSKLGITKKEFEKRVLLECLPRYYWVHGQIRWHVQRSYFEPDLLLIQSVANCTSIEQMMPIIKFHQETGFFCSGYERRLIRFRLSGRRLIRFAKQVLS